ncbi:MAG: hypothetical protein MZV64_37115 [Ignavibacteriales bacterium]|nr:hypothetical protein [Ignavibacteriales bacterium]
MPEEKGIIAVGSPEELVTHHDDGRGSKPFFDRKAVPSLITTRQTNSGSGFSS